MLKKKTKTMPSLVSNSKLPTSSVSNFKLHVSILASSSSPTRNKKKRRIIKQFNIENITSKKQTKY